MHDGLGFELGVKTDPIEYRYSHPWLFDLLAEIGIRYVQIGTHFELYQLPDEFFYQLKEQADQRGLVIHSTFTAHRELGGFFREEPGYEEVARKNFERYIQVGAILGAQSVGSNPGAVMRDRMEFKAEGTRRYLKHLKELLHFAYEQGVPWLTIEPMSCLAEPPTLPDECIAMGRELDDYHRANPETTSRAGFCADIAHGYVNRDGEIVYDHFELFEATIPWLYEVHLKNTDGHYNSTFGFNEQERGKGIIDVAEFRRRLVRQAGQLPVSTMVGYLEIGGPKLGRDYSDHQLEGLLRDSFEYLKRSWLKPGEAEPAVAKTTTRAVTHGAGEEISLNLLAEPTRDVLISPSMMCADQLHFAAELAEMESLGCDMLHMDIMDARFVPNMAMGLGILEQACAVARLPIDVHLMVEDNDFFVDQMKDWRVHQISVHYETATHLDRTLERIRDQGAKAGLALNPATPLEVLDYVVERLDYVLIMTVNPGYAGQKMTPASIRKIRDCREKLDRLGLVELPIQVDGNVSFENIPAMVAAGAANLVAGTSSIFHRDQDRATNLERIRQCILQAQSVLA